MNEPTQTASEPEANTGPALGEGQLYVFQAIAGGILTAALAVSYMHLVELFQTFGELGWRAYAIAGTVDSLIVLGVLGGRAARDRGETAGGAVRRLMTAGIAATIVGNVHHGLRANLPESVFADGLLNPDIDALGVVTVVVGILVSLWAPLAAELAYRGLLWAQDQLRALRTASVAQVPAEAPAAAVEEAPVPDPEPEPIREDDAQDDDEPRPAPEPQPVPAADVDDAVILDFYRRRQAVERVSERRLVALVETELGTAITRHRAKQIIAAAKLSANPAGQREFAAA